MDKLFHIEWGDGDNSFVLAKDDVEAREKMGDVKDMITMVVELPAVFQSIYNVGYTRAIEHLAGRVESGKVRWLEAGLEAGKVVGRQEERERIHDYIQILVKNGDLEVNDGVLLYDIIQDTLPIKYCEVGLVRQILKKGKL